ncbi:hypothetical protein WN51_01126 [Melipona quadrifasciata]|uniref:Uncharacterized protein n=1 Tax=Melipona quadrifasciata TaxID=166423 RepID=A0A0M9A0E6_9HYME|nr:hypothetical protein WN51_01126 [Melipona quadrifasciata]
MAADTVALSALTLARGDKILVTVESALPDIIVVSFVHGAKCFQGALLDATKRDTEKVAVLCFLKGLLVLDFAYYVSIYLSRVISHRSNQLIGSIALVVA